MKGTAQITVTAKNGEDTVEGVEYEFKSSDDEVATVDKDGKVTGVAEGTATITVTTTNAKEERTTKVDVTVIKADEAPVEDQDLETAIAAVTEENKKVEAEYTSETWGPFAAALEAAQDADTINKLAKDLTEATTKLVKKVKITGIEIGNHKVNEDNKVTLTKGDMVETVTETIKNFEGTELKGLSLVMTQSDVTNETDKEEIAKNHGKNFFDFEGKPKINIKDGTLTMTMNSGKEAATAGEFTFVFKAEGIEPITITVLVTESTEE